MNRIAILSQAFAGKFSSIIKQRSNPSSTIAPGIHNHNRQYRSIRLLSTLLLSLLLLLSVPALALKAYSYSFIESNIEMGFYLINNENQMAVQAETLVAALPLNLFRVPEKLVLVVAMLNILLSMAHLAFVAWDWKAGRRTQTRAFRRNALVIHTINTIMVLIALIAMSVSHKASSTFQAELIPREPNAVSPSGYRYFRYDAGTFDLETWTCELMHPDSVGEARKDYQAQCNIEVAGRMMMAPFFLAALAVTGLSVWTLVAGGEQGPSKEYIYAKDADLEMGTQPDHGKRVQVEEVELTTLQRPERQKDGRLSKIDEDGEESEETPKRESMKANVENDDNVLMKSEGADANVKKAGGSS
ncbi:hypothetical protein SVAN01_00009 [Stagonosporopsis vannaccii]|nr:hypothetical protein SVAN01_00009 [Stagonosporopsis vannaccii]